MSESLSSRMRAFVRAGTVIEAAERGKASGIRAFSDWAHARETVLGVLHRRNRSRDEQPARIVSGALGRAFHTDAGRRPGGVVVVRLLPAPWVARRVDRSPGPAAKYP